MEKRLQTIEFEYDDNVYVFDVGIEEVKAIAKASASTGGKITTLDLFKLALRKSSEVRVITDAKATEITEALMVSGLALQDDELSFEELRSWIIGLFLQALDDEAKKYEPAELEIHENNSATVTLKEKEYKLDFTKKIIQDSYANNEIQFNNLLEFYVSGTNLIDVALRHNSERFSVTTKDRIFFSLWANNFEEETSHYFSELVDALIFRMNNIVEETAKKSKAVIKGKVK